MAAALLACILGVLCLWFGLAALTAAWRVCDALVQGVQFGCIAIWKAVRGPVLAAIAVGHWMARTDESFGQRVHAAWWSYSYWLKRAYIASALRARRRENKA